MIKIEKGILEFDSLQWLCGNVSKKSIGNENLNEIVKCEVVNGVTTLICTDTVRMAMLRYEQDCPLEEGLWKVSKSAKEIVFNEIKFDGYPDWKSVVPDKSAMRKINQPRVGYFAFTNKGAFQQMALDVCYLLAQKAFVNYKHLEDIGKIFCKRWEVYSNDRLVYFEAKSHNGFDKYALLISTLIIDEDKIQ